MTTCKKCGKPLTRGNVKLVQHGKIRLREHRTCPDEASSLTKTNESSSLKRMKLVRSTKKTSPPKSNEASRHEPMKLVASNKPPEPQKAQAPSEPDHPQMRYFIREGQYEKLTGSLRPFITLEVIIVPAYQVEQNPDGLEGLVEINFTRC